jgi:hypothetical protein
MLYRILRYSSLLTTLFVFAASAAVAGKDLRTERVQFQRGSNNAVVEGSITGYETVDYVLGASNGQYMNVSMETDNTANYFNILSPGENEVAMFNGSIGENQFEGILPKSGDYRIRVYMMRSAARRNEVANYRLEMIITEVGDKRSSQSSGPSGRDVLVGGTQYHATGNIPCALDASQPIGSCPFGVTREGNGNGSVTVTKTDGRTRTIHFKNGKAIGADGSQADPGDFRATRRGDVTVVSIGVERYEIPDAVIFGG